MPKNRGRRAKPQRSRTAMARPMAVNKAARRATREQGGRGEAKDRKQGGAQSRKDAQAHAIRRQCQMAFESNEIRR